MFYFTEPGKNVLDRTVSVQSEKDEDEHFEPHIEVNLLLQQVSCKTIVKRLVNYL